MVLRYSEVRDQKRAEEENIPCDQAFQIWPQNPGIATEVDS